MTVTDIRIEFTYTQPRPSAGFRKKSIRGTTAKRQKERDKKSTESKSKKNNKKKRQKEENE